MTADAYKSTGNFIRRDKTGIIVGQIRIAVLKTSSAGGLLKWANRWQKTLTAQGATMVKMNLERSQPPHAITTDAPLLIVADYPTRCQERKGRSREKVKMPNIPPAVK